MSQLARAFNVLGVRCLASKVATLIGCARLRKLFQNRKWRRVFLVNAIRCFILNQTSEGADIRPDGCVTFPGFLPTVFGFQNNRRTCNELQGTKEYTYCTTEGEKTSNNSVNRQETWGSGGIRSYFFLFSSLLMQMLDTHINMIQVEAD